MPQSATPTYRFAGLSDLPLEATVDGGRLTSDGGLPWLGEAEAALGLCPAFAACLLPPVSAAANPSRTIFWLSSAADLPLAPGSQTYRKRWPWPSSFFVSDSKRSFEKP